MFKIFSLVGALLLTAAPAPFAQDTPAGAEPAAPAPSAAVTPAPAAPAKKSPHGKAAKKKKKAKKPYDYNASKYKAVMPPATSSYRYDAKGNPVAAKKGKRAKRDAAETSESDAAAGDVTCTDAEPCSK